MSENKLNELNLFSGALRGVDYSEPSCSDSITSDTLNSTTTVSESLPKESKTAISTTPPSMAISEHSLIQDDVSYIEALRISSQRDSHASHSRLLESERHQTMQETCGRQQWKLSKESSHPFASLKTSLDYSRQQWITNQMDLFTTMERYCETWPKAGTMQNGVCWGLMMSELRTEEKEFGYLLPTPNTSERGGKQAPGSQLSLTKKMNGWEKDGSFRISTPRANRSMAQDLNLPSIKNNPNPNLETQISNFILPTCGANEGKGTSRKRFKGSPDYRGAKTSEALRTSKNDPIYLNPCFAEWMMGWPINWTSLTKTTDLKQWEMVSAHKQ